MSEITGCLEGADRQEFIETANQVIERVLELIEPDNIERVGRFPDHGHLPSTLRLLSQADIVATEGAVGEQPARSRIIRKFQLGDRDGNQSGVP